MRNPRFRGVILASLLGIVGASAPDARATVLSGMMQFTSNAMGGANGGGAWNTQGGDGVSNLWVLNPYGLPGVFNVNGPADANAGISITLTPGLFVFDIYGEPGTDPNNWATLNLFFNGNTVNPGITAMRSTVFPPVGAFGSTLSSGTLSLAGTPTTGAGSLVFNDGMHNVVITEYWFAQSGSQLFADIGSAFAETPNGIGDFVGRVELTVTAVPAPGAAAMLGVMGVVAGRRRRR